MATRKGSSARKRPAAKRTTDKALASYKAKRDFTKTSEPAGGSARSKARQLEFVIQKHAASHLHFDLRLELDGVMKSWAVPKGPHYDPKVRRLAMQVEDHPIEYNQFEGTIPKGEYGGGTVMIWDRGTYGAEDGGDEDTIRSGYDRGDLKIVMHGTRMLGGWVLVRTRRDERGRAQWLLIKHRDAFASADLDVVADANTSIVTGRTMEEIARGAASKRSRRTRAKP
jgi:bifunctional non-homologous end joining protein LigD